MTKEKKTGRFAAMTGRIRQLALDMWNYCAAGVWEDKRDNLKVNIVKTLNLTVRTFMSSDLQSRACAMTYRSLLAIVPTLALLFAIGRGFGFQNLLQNQLYLYFPSQHRALEMAFSFVDSCLAQASGGIFVGVGIVFLLWTLISLLDSVEESFNDIWGVTTNRPVIRKITDYLAICIILPVLMICSSGLQIFMSNTVQHLLPFDFLSPILESVFDIISVVFAWLFFAGAYMLIPNTKVRFTNAIIAGIIAGTSFQFLQWLFVSGQIYVSKYNAIYGSFSFLPLMLIWMQLSWLITLAGALICCSAQNIYMFSFEHQTNNISSDYRRKVSLTILTIILRRFKKGEKPLSVAQLSTQFVIPPKLTGMTVNELIACGLVIRTAPAGGNDNSADATLVPAMSLEHYSLGHVIRVLGSHGEAGFIPEMDLRFSHLMEICDRLSRQTENAADSTLLAEIEIGPDQPEAEIH